MKLQRRERILAYSLGGLLVVVVGYVLFFAGESRSTAELQSDLENLTRDVEAKRQLAKLDHRDAKWMRDWRKRALPSDRNMARTLYQTWLRGLADQCRFHPLTVESKEINPRPGIYTGMSFTVRGHVSLADLAQFLYGFYSAGHLHQIRELSMKPVEHSSELDVNMRIEALSLPNADRKDRLSTEKGKGLRLAKIEDYRDPIVKRNLFAPYTAPPPPMVAEKGTSKPQEPVDMAQFTIVTGFTEVDGLRQVWIQDRMAGKLWQLTEGGKFKIGQLSGTVRKIDPNREVTLDFDGHCRRFHDGDNLRGGVEVAGQAKN